MSNTKARKDERGPLELRIIEAPDSERQVLIAVLEHRTIPAVAEELLPEDFSHPREQRFWKVARELDRSGNLTLDALTERLTKGEPEGGKPEEGIVAYLSTLAAEEAVPPTLLPRYVAQIKNAARKREIRDYHREALKRLEAGELDADAHIRESKAKLEKWEATPSSDAKPVSTRLKGIYESILSEGTKPVPTFSAQLNANLNGGLQRGEVITIASPAGAGKTTFALQLAEETIREQSRRVDGPPCAVVYVTIEMSEKELITKSLSRLGRVDSGHIRDKSIGEAKLKPAMDTYEKELSPVVYFIEAHEGMTLGEVRSTTRKVKTRLADAVKGTTENPDALEPFVILCVDPFQRLLTDNAAVDSEEISRVGALASGLKQLARDLGVAVILPADTTKDTARKAEAGERGGGGAIRGSYVATHTTDELVEIIAWDESPEAKNENEKLLKKYGDLFTGYTLNDFDALSVPAYAVLSFSKNRWGVSSPCPFVWERAYNRFVPVGEKQERDNGGTKERLLEWWGIERRKAGEKAYPHKRRATGGK